MKNPVTIAICLGLSIGLFLLYFAAVIYQKMVSKMAFAQKEDWLFYRFNEKLYDALFGIELPEDVLSKLGIDPEEYYEDCRVADRKPEPKKLIAQWIYGFLIFLLSIIFTILISPLFLFFGLLFLLYFLYGERFALKKAAEDKRYQIQCELPDFLDLLCAELSIGLPIEQAISILTSKEDTLIAREFNWAFSNMELGAGSWLSAMETVALKYNVETLNDFVSKISIAYAKGISIADTVAQEVNDIKKTHFMLVKEKAGKMVNTILVPIAIFQFVPMLALIMLPVITEVMKM